MLLQWSMREVMKAWIRVSAAGKEREGRRWVIFLWWKAVFVTDFMCWLKLRELSKMTPRLRQ